MRHFHRFIAVFLVLVAGLLASPLNITGLGLTHIPGDLGDARFCMYILEHGYQFLQGKHEWYWNAPFMYPVENVITFSENFLGTVPIYSLFSASNRRNARQPILRAEMR